MLALALSLFLNFIITYLLFIYYKKSKIYEFYPKVSVIISAWNEEKTIESVVERVKNQNYKNDYEIIIIGGGEDKTAEICKKLSKNKKIKFIEEKNSKGKYYCLNKALEKSKYDYIAIIDADSFAKTDWLKKIINPLFKKNIHISIGLQGDKEKKIPGQDILIFLIQSVFSGLLKLGIACWADGANMAFKKEVWKKVKFQNYLLEDYAFVLIAKKMGFHAAAADNNIVDSEQPRNLKDYYKRNSRFYRGLLELSPKFPIVIIHPISLWALGLVLYYFDKSILLINLLFLLIWAAAIKLKNKTKLGPIQFLNFIFLLILFFIFSFFYSLEYLNPQKRKEWTRI